MNKSKSKSYNWCIISKRNFIFMENDKSSSKLYRRLKKLKELLHKGDVYFTYEKKDGTLRDAHGTLKKSLIPEDDLPDDRTKDEPRTCFCYYDLDKEDWRTFLKKNFKEIKNND